MPDRCSVTGCKSNYSSTSENYVSVFQFPKDESERKLWIRKIPRKNWSPGPSARVCELHFAPQYVSKVMEYVDGGGNKKTFPRKRAVLLPGAVPTIFQNLPSYLSTAPAPERSDPAKRRRIIAEREEEVLKKHAQDTQLKQMILNYNDLIRSYREHVPEGTSWKFEITNEFLIVYKTDFVDSPRITVSAKINCALSVIVYLNGLKVATTELNSAIGTKNCTLTKWSHFETMLLCYDSTSINSASSLLSVQRTVSSCFIEIIDHFEEDEEKSKKMRFLAEQFELACCVNKNAIRYTPSMMVNSFMIHMLSPACYDGLRANFLLTLPHPNRLIQLTQKFGVSVDSRNNEHFLKLKNSTLEDREKFVLLQVCKI